MKKGSKATYAAYGLAKSISEARDNTTMTSPANGDGLERGTGHKDERQKEEEEVTFGLRRRTDFAGRGGEAAKIGMLRRVKVWYRM